MRQLTAGPALAAAFALAAAGAAAQPAPAGAPATPAGPAVRKAAPGSERTAVLAALDKRLGTTAEFTLKPGERFTFGRLSGVLRNCERTQPFERKQSAAFVQLVETPATPQGRPATKPVLIFSGWLFAESPSLNPVVHPVYDVWLKSCTMRFPDGPSVPSSSGGRKGPSSGRSAPRSSETPAPAPAPATPAAAPVAAPAADPAT